MKTYCAWCPRETPPMQDDGRGDGLVSHGICPLHMQYMLAKLKEAGSADHVQPNSEEG